MRTSIKERIEFVAGAHSSTTDINRVSEDIYNGILTLLKIEDGSDEANAISNFLNDENADIMDIMDIIKNVKQ